jgi:predicted RNase H-like HicB family nuclease|tara:strand:+ start:164 stop:346 length:183 start_codon:yes stop_codon:yes gene_type:complete
MEDLPQHSPFIEKDGNWFIATCLEFPGANGQGKTKAEAKESLAHAIEVLEEDRVEDESFN